MASLAIAAQDESLPSTSNGSKYRLPTTLLDGCRAVKHASVPKKLRSAIKKRGRESITLPLQIRKKKHHKLSGVDKLRKDGTKKSRLNMREGHITKDEEEVAQTLYALAGMFTDARESDHENPETKSLATLEQGGSTEGEESREIPSKVPLGIAAHSSNLVDLTAQNVKSQSFEAQQLTSRAGGSRPAASIIGMAPCVESKIDLEQVGPFGVQYEKKYNPIDDKYTHLLSAPSSETQRSCPSTRLPESTNVGTQTRLIEDSITTEKYTGVAIESKKSWKRCTAHVYISRLIKVLQISDRKEELPTNNQIINGRNDGASSSGINDSFPARKDSSEMQNDIRIHERPVQDQQMASQTTCSRKQVYDFLSLGAGLVDAHEPPKQYHPSYLQPQDHSSKLSSVPTFQCHNSAQQVQVPLYSSSFPMEQKWGGGAGGRESACVLNYAHAIFPHVHTALGSPSQELLLALKRHQLHFPQRNGAAFSSQNLQLPCNHHL